MNGKNYRGSIGPVGGEADGRISCFSGGAGRQMSSSIYADMPAPNPPPTPSSTSQIGSDGECDVVVIVSIAQIIHQIMDQIRHVTFFSETLARFLWTISP